MTKDEVMVKSTVSVSTQTDRKLQAMHPLKPGEKPNIINTDDPKARNYCRILIIVD